MPQPGCVPRGCGSGFAEHRFVELLPPAKRGGDQSKSPVGDLLGLPKNQVYKLRKVYGGLPAELATCARIWTAPVWRPRPAASLGESPQGGGGVFVHPHAPETSVGP